MSHIAKCPECDGEVILPADVQQNDAVQCQSCAAELLVMEGNGQYELVTLHE